MSGSDAKFQDADSMLGILRRTGGFLQAAVGNQIEFTETATTLALTFKNATTTFYTITITYTDSSKSTVQDITRTA